MKTTLKEQRRVVHTIKRTKEGQIEQLQYNDSISPLRPKTVKAFKELEKQVQVLNDVESTLAAINLIGEKKIAALPQLIKLAEAILEGERKSDYMIHHNACRDLKKLLKTL